MSRATRWAAVDGLVWWRQRCGREVFTARGLWGGSWFVVRADFQSLEALAEAIPVLGKGDESRAPIFYLGIYYSLLTGQPTVYSYVK